MKDVQHFGQNETTKFRSVPVVRLDSGAVKIPVELVENISGIGEGRRVLRITMTNGSFCAWR